MEATKLQDTLADRLHYIHHRTQKLYRRMTNLTTYAVGFALLQIALTLYADAHHRDPIATIAALACAGVVVVMASICEVSWMRCRILLAEAKGIGLIFEAADDHRV